MGKSVKYKELDVNFKAKLLAKLEQNSIVQENGCIIWTKHLDNFGYGKFTLNYNKVEYTVTAHRVSYFINKGEIPEGQVVRHLCHNPACFNSDHLDIGTQKQNIHDSIKDDRHAFGSKNGRAKLTEEDVILIINLYNSKQFTQGDIADRFGVSRRCIKKIMEKTNWKTVWNKIS